MYLTWIQSNFKKKKKKTQKLHNGVFESFKDAPF